MMDPLSKLVSILKSDEGMITVEYGVILSGVVLVATAVIAGLAEVGDNVEGVMAKVNTYLNSVAIPAS